MVTSHQASQPTEREAHSGRLTSSTAEEGWARAASNKSTCSSSTSIRQPASRHLWNTFSSPFVLAQSTLNRAPSSLRSSVSSFWPEQENSAGSSNDIVRPGRRASYDVSALIQDAQLPERVSDIHTTLPHTSGLLLPDAQLLQTHAQVLSCEEARTARNQRRRSYAGTSSVTARPTVTFAALPVTIQPDLSVARSAPSSSTMSRLFGDHVRRPASAGGSSKPFDAGSGYLPKSSLSHPKASESTLPASSTSLASRQLAATTSLRSVGSSSGLLSESSWGSLGSDMLSTAPSSVLSSSPKSTSLNKKVSSFSPRRPQTASTGPPGQMPALASTVSSPRKAASSPQDDKPHAPMPVQAAPPQHNQSLRRDLPYQPGTVKRSATDQLESWTSHYEPPGTSNRVETSSANRETARYLPKGVQASLSPHFSKSGLPVRHSTESRGSDQSKSLHDSRPSIEPGSHTSSQNEHENFRHADDVFGLPYGQKSTIFTQPDRLSFSYSGPGYQAGDVTSKDWSFFSRMNWSSPLDHPCPPNEVPYMYGYDGATLDYQYIRYQAAKEAGCMIPWSNVGSFQTLKPAKVLDVGCGITASWILEAAATWTEPEFVGMDIAPVLIPLSRSPSTSASRVSFIQANFLETWPFEDDSFDFVRIAFIGSATPEHLWQHIFDEATRVLTKKGWLQCIDEVSVFRPPKPFAQVDRKLEENLDAFATTSSAEDGSLDAQTDSESHTVLLVKARAFERALKSMEQSFQERMLSLYPTSIYPAAMVLTCKEIVTQGPVRVGLGMETTEQAALSKEASRQEVNARVLIDAKACAVEGWANIFRENKAAAPGPAKDLRAQADWRSLAGTIRSRSDISSLLSDRFGWTCKMDEQIEKSLEQQVIAVENERRLLLASQGESIVDEHKLAEVDRALRDVKADLAATRRRLGKTVAARPDWLSPQELANMKVGSEILVKTGKKAVCVNKSELL